MWVNERERAAREKSFDTISFHRKIIPLLCLVDSFHLRYFRTMAAGKREPLSGGCFQTRFRQGQRLHHRQQGGLRCISGRNSKTTSWGPVSVPLFFRIYWEDLRWKTPESGTSFVVGDTRLSMLYIISRMDCVSMRPTRIVGVVRLMVWCGWYMHACTTAVVHPEIFDGAGGGGAVPL